MLAYTSPNDSSILEIGFDSEDDYRMDCRNVSHCQQQSWTTITRTTITTTITTITPTITTYL